MLHLALYLVEKKYFKTVEFIFYIRGHTKNVCDRLFKLLYQTSKISITLETDSFLIFGYDFNKHLKNAS